MIRPLGMHVLRSACRSLADWRRRGLVAPTSTVSVNISARRDRVGHRHRHRRRADRGAATRREPRRRADREHADRQSRADAVAPPADPRPGVRFHLDDFGTGHSSLTLLHHFPGNTLKIDRSFVATIDEREESKAIIRSIAHLADNLGLRVIAEGIEHPRHVDCLRDLGCESGQGYYFARPLPPSEVESLLAATSTGRSAVADSGLDGVLERVEAERALQPRRDPAVRADGEQPRLGRQPELAGAASRRPFRGRCRRRPPGG